MQQQNEPHHFCAFEIIYLQFCVAVKKKNETEYLMKTLFLLILIVPPLSALHSRVLLLQQSLGREGHQWDLGTPVKASELSLNRSGLSFSLHPRNHLFLLTTPILQMAFSRICTSVTSHSTLLMFIIICSYLFYINF